MAVLIRISNCCRLAGDMLSAFGGVPFSLVEVLLKRGWVHSTKTRIAGFGSMMSADQHARGDRLLDQVLDPACGRVDALKQDVERILAVKLNEQFTVEDEFFRG